QPAGVFKEGHASDQHQLQTLLQRGPANSGQPALTLSSGPDHVEQELQTEGPVLTGAVDFYVAPSGAHMEPWFSDVPDSVLLVLLVPEVRGWTWPLVLHVELLEELFLMLDSVGSGDVLK
ncbi:hypothetical protein XENOCAPTIV_026899, partial [Xenoophorus captivus]